MKKHKLEPLERIAYLFCVLTAFWISLEYVLRLLGREIVGEMSVQLVKLVVGTVVALAGKKSFDHWLQDHYGTDKDGRPWVLSECDSEEET